jgi:hypothetical protein
MKMPRKSAVSWTNVRANVVGATLRRQGAKAGPVEFRVVLFATFSPTLAVAVPLHAAHLSEGLIWTEGAAALLHHHRHQ